MEDSLGSNPVAERCPALTSNRALATSPSGQGRPYRTVVTILRKHALAYLDGSASGGTGNRGFGIYIMCGTTSRIWGRVGEQIFSFDFELKAVTECSRLVIRRKQEGAALTGMVIFTDCRALVQYVGGTGRKEALWLADHLHKTKGTVVQWLPSHEGIIGNEIADKLAKQGRT
ncbi:RNA-directed DNA polymerase from [Plakobranchus ocellatus]|uniref:RNA-directed DNA polymerase from n=1 Tax=Plakobranchus ocellatus TaxID=259542 RepID=A0AAV4AKF5_9GAST|nr:RNA-directed DNA polymerase from [Plakobranchus ocellatus]